MLGSSMELHAHAASNPRQTARDRVLRANIVLASSSIAPWCATHSCPRGSERILSHSRQLVLRGRRPIMPSYESFAVALCPRVWKR